MRDCLGTKPFSNGLAVQRYAEIGIEEEDLVQIVVLADSVATVRKWANPLKRRRFLVRENRDDRTQSTLW